MMHMLSALGLSMPCRALGRTAVMRGVDGSQQPWGGVPHSAVMFFGLARFGGGSVLNGSFSHASSATSSRSRLQASHNPCSANVQRTDHRCIDCVRAWPIETVGADACIMICKCRETEQELLGYRGQIGCGPRRHDGRGSRRSSSRYNDTAHSCFACCVLRATST